MALRTALTFGSPSSIRLIERRYRAAITFENLLYDGLSLPDVQSRVDVHRYNCLTFNRWRTHKIFLISYRSRSLRLLIFYILYSPDCQGCG